MTSLKQQLEAAIVQFWEDVSLSDAAEPGGGPQFPEAMDSLTAVEALLVLEKVVNMKLEAHEIIRRGGYDSKEQFVEDLTDKVLKYVDEKKAGVEA